MKKHLLMLSGAVFLFLSPSYGMVREGEWEDFQKTKYNHMNFMQAAAVNQKINKEFPMLKDFSISNWVRQKQWQQHDFSLQRRLLACLMEEETPAIPAVLAPTKPATPVGAAATAVSTSSATRLEEEIRKDPEFSKLPNLHGDFFAHNSFEECMKANGWVLLGDEKIMIFFKILARAEQKLSIPKDQSRVPEGFQELAKESEQDKTPTASLGGSASNTAKPVAAGVSSSASSAAAVQPSVNGGLESKIQQHQQAIVKVSGTMPRPTTLTADAHEYDAYLKQHHQTFLVTANELFGSAPSSVDVNAVRQFLEQHQGAVDANGFTDINGAPIILAAVKQVLLDNWTRHAGQTSGNSGINVDQIRATTFHALQQLGQRDGYDSEGFRTCLRIFIQNGADAGVTCLEGHTNRHWLTLQSILSTYLPSYF